jgi:tripartite-type tricarboxylate transporter receptor subunit TctC
MGRKFFGEDMKSNTFIKFVTCIFGLLMSSVLMAQTYPNRAITLIVPFPPGGATDILARVLSENLPAKLGQPVIIENKPGGSTVIGVMSSLRAPPDGYTALVSANSSFTVLPALKANLPYDIEKDLYPINLSVSTPLVLVTSVDKPYTKLSELIAQAKAKPNTLRYSSYGPGTSPHLASEIFASAAQIDIEQVPYKGSSDSIFAIIRGDVDFGLETIPAAISQIKAGKLRALAVTSLTRSRFLPDTPALDELRLSSARYLTVYGVAISSSVPRPITSKLAKAVSDVMSTPEVKEKMAMQSLEVVNEGPEAMAAFINSDIARFKALNKRLNIQLE